MELTLREKDKLLILTAALLPKGARSVARDATTRRRLRLSWPLSWKARATARQRHFMGNGGRHSMIVS